MKTAHRIIANCDSASEAMDDAESATICRLHNDDADLLKYVFGDCSVLVFRGSDYFGFDSTDAESIRAYAEWVATENGTESAYIASLLKFAN